MQLRRLKECILIRVTHTKRANGTVSDNYNELSPYKIIPQDLQDQISASIYGANINKIIRILSIRRRLEKLLSTKLNNQADNISNYVIKYDNKIYKIVSVKNNWIDMEAMSEVNIIPNGSV